MEKILKKAPIVGFIRYSQKITFRGGARDVFEPTYFEYRFKIFTDVTLRSFQKQTDTEFVLIIFHSVSMPLQYKERFQALEKENQFLYNVFVEDNVESFNKAIKDSIRYVSTENNVALTFRIDNDDAVQINFIHTLKKFLNKEFVGFTINMPNVLIVKRVTNKSYMIEERDYPSNSIGLAYVTGKDDYRTVLEVAQHHLINDENALILMPKNSSVGLMTINGENAANAIDSSKAKILNENELNSYLRGKHIYNLDFNCLRLLVEKDEFTRISFKNVTALLLPPIVPWVFRKILRTLIRI